MGEGKVGGMVCPDPTCKMEATPDEVRKCLSAEDWERFEPQRKWEEAAPLSLVRNQQPRCSSSFLSVLL